MFVCFCFLWWRVFKLLSVFLWLPKSSPTSLNNSNEAVLDMKVDDVRLEDWFRIAQSFITNINLVKSSCVVKFYVFSHIRRHVCARIWLIQCHRTLITTVCKSLTFYNYEPRNLNLFEDWIKNIAAFESLFILCCKTL